MSLHRRAVLGLGLAAATAALTGCRDERSATRWLSPAEPAPTVAATAAGTSAPSPSASATASPSPTTAPYAAKLTQVLKRYLKPTPENPNHPTYAGAVALVMVGGKTTAHIAVGEALRYGAGPVLLPADKRVAMRPDSIFDLASITKVYTAILALQQVDQGRIDLDAPVVEYLPEFDGPGKDAITVSMLLAHTSGLPVGAKVTGYSSNAERWAAVMATPLVSGAVPGKTFRYSSVGLMVLGKIIEKVTGKSLDQALRANLTGPLGLRYTGFNPNKWLGTVDRNTRLAATDARSSRGLLRGVVHDDVANHLGGIAGHAGIFSTAEEVAVIGQMLLDGGRYGGKRILSEATVRRMLTNVNAGVPAIDPERPNRPSDHGLGVVLNQPWFMGKLASRRTFGHTGFTGTSLLVDPSRRLVLVLLTNRAHPNWSWANPDPVRVAVADVVARAL
ncbi:MAG TPA: serine hydrolase domain-containing protein [Micromonosporaceae bacterium]